PNNYSEPLPYYSIAAALRPDLRIYVNLGHLLIKKQDWDGVLAVSQKALEVAPESERAVRALAHNNLGAGLGAKGDWKRAEIEFRAAINLDADCASAHHNLGELMLRHGRPDEAVTALERAIALGAAHSGTGGRLDASYLRKESAERYFSLGN